MTKTLNQIIIFFLHQNQNIFFGYIGNQNIFLEKKHNPPFKLNGRSLKLPVNRYLAINIEGIIGQPTIIRTTLVSKEYLRRYQRNTT